MNYQIYDISPLISPEIAVFPDDTEFRSHVLLDMKKGDNLTLSSMTTTVHLGAHADAPSHYSRLGPSIAERDLSLYLGPAQVIEVARVALQKNFSRGSGIDKHSSATRALQNPFFPRSQSMDFGFHGSVP